MSMLSDLKDRQAEDFGLVEWLQQFADSTLPVSPNPSGQQVRQAIATHLPQKLAGISPEASAEKLLEQALGIAVIVQYGREKIGWAVTKEADEASVLQQLYSSSAYRGARSALGIDGQWILLVNPELLEIYGLDELMAAEPYPIEMYDRYPQLLSIEERQECLVIEL